MSAPFHAADPFDEHNQALVGHVHPADWVNPPVPNQPYQMLVVGGGTAGLVTAAGSAGMGARVALIERGMLGGDCLNVGCVPSKAIIACAAAAQAARGQPELGVQAGGVQIDFGQAMQSMRRARASIAPVDSAATLADKGVDVFLGSARFTGPHTVAVTGDDGTTTTLRFNKACIATGGHAVLPPIDGLADVGALTNETVFSLTRPPAHLGVIGGGPIGSELAQAFARLGVRVTLINRAGRILDKESEETSELLRTKLEADGVDVRLNMNTTEVRREGEVIRLTADGSAPLELSHVLVSTGRAPNVEGLGLEAAGVAFDGRAGVQVDDRLRTTCKHIYAAGDVASRYKFTHAADALARIVIANALFMGRKKASSLIIPWATYVSPEVAHVGAYASELDAQKTPYDTHRVGFDDVDRAICESDTEGWVEVFTRAGTGTLLGATVVGPHAADLLVPFVVGMERRIPLGKLGAAVLPYPSRGEVVRKLADRYNRTRLTPGVKALMARWLRWTA